MNGDTLAIWKGQDEFGLFFMNSTLNFRVREHPDFPNAFLIEEFDHEELVNRVTYTYVEEGVESIWDLLEKILENPERALEDLIGKKFQIERVVELRDKY